MSSFQDQMAKKIQAAARGYITRKVGLGKGKKHGKGGKKHGKGGKKHGGKKSPNVQAMVIQAAFRKYQQHQKKN